MMKSLAWLFAAAALAGCAEAPLTPEAAPGPEAPPQPVVPATVSSAERRAAIEQRVAQRRVAQSEAARLEALERELTPLEREWGIKLLGIRLTANGYALDLRYKVLDPQKAAPIVQRRFSPTPMVIVERTGARLGVPFTDKAGSLRSSVTTVEQIKRGRDYMALFANPGKHTKPGDKVTVAIGAFRAENLVVQ
jgi:hypothetical protein